MGRLSFSLSADTDSYSTDILFYHEVAQVLYHINHDTLCQELFVCFAHEQVLQEG